MPNNEETYNYPDVLGYITDVERHNIGFVQMAMAVKPDVPRAGRPFEVIMLLQNMADSVVEVTVTVTVPDRDADGKKDRFIVGVPRLVVSVQPGEVGYASLPVSTTPDAAVSKEYKVSMDISVKAQERKPTRVRTVEGGIPFKINSMPRDKQEPLAKIKQLVFSTTKKSGFFRGNALEVTFGLLQGRVGKLARLKPGWVSLWSAADHQDDSIMLQKYAEQMRLKILPELRRDKLFKPLLAKTESHFKKIGYELSYAEANFLTRLLVLILEYASASETQHGSLAAGIYDIEGAVAPDVDYSQRNVRLPYWTKRFFSAMAHDARVAKVPVKAIAHFVYEDLLHDAIIYGFEVLEVATGEDLGTPEEMEEYAADVLVRLKKKDEMSFTHVYLPLVLGGIVSFDKVLLDDERLGDVLQGVRPLVAERKSERTEDNDSIFSMAQNIIEHTLQKYGYKNK